MRDGERWHDDGSPGSGTDAALSLADWPDIDLTSLSPLRLLGLVRAADPRRADDRESLGVVSACEQILRFVTALQLRFIHRAVTAGGPQEDPTSTFDVFTGADLVGAELASLFGLSKRSAQSKVWQACGLVTDLPKLVDLIEAGSLDLQRAGAVDDVLREVLEPTDDAWHEVHESIADQAPNRSNRWLREQTRREIHNADPQAAARRHQKALAGREVRVYPLPHAMANVTASLPADQAQLVDTVLNALADGCRDQTRAAGNPDPRTHDQRRADAFVALFRSVATGTPFPVLPDPDPLRAGVPAGDDQAYFGGRVVATPSGPAAVQGVPGIVAWWRPPSVPQQQGRRPQITVTVPLHTLIGADDRAADLAGYGPVPAELVRAMAAEGANYRVVPAPERPAPRHTRQSPSQASSSRPPSPPPARSSPTPPSSPPARSSPTPRSSPTARSWPTPPSLKLPRPSPPRPPSPLTSSSRSVTSPRAPSSPSPAGEHMSESSPSDDPVAAFHGPGDVARCTSKDRSYRPAQSVIDWVVAFHQECRHPNCERPARSCDIDHVVEHPEGPTCRCNLMPLCRFHHRLKTHGGWSARFTTPDEPHPKGTVEWISRAGLRYYDEPRLYSLGFGSENGRAGDG